MKILLSNPIFHLIWPVFVPILKKYTAHFCSNIKKILLKIGTDVALENENNFTKPNMLLCRTI